VALKALPPECRTLGNQISCPTRRICRATNSASNRLFSTSGNFTVARYREKSGRHVARGPPGRRRLFAVKRSGGRVLPSEPMGWLIKANQPSRAIMSRQTDDGSALHSVRSVKPRRGHSRIGLSFPESAVSNPRATVLAGHHWQRWFLQARFEALLEGRRMRPCAPRFLLRSRGPGYSRRLSRYSANGHSTMKV
jgi:hypothetical protein